MIDEAQLEADLNEVLARVFPVVTQPAYRFFYRKGMKDQCFWTTETVQHKGKPKYASGVYKYLKTRKAYKLTQERYHAKRRDAKARARELFKATAPVV